jgi:hypothetical protein
MSIRALGFDPLLKQFTFVFCLFLTITPVTLVTGLTTREIAFLSDAASNWTNLPPSWRPEDAANGCRWEGVFCNNGIINDMYESSLYSQSNSCFYCLELIEMLF